MRPQVRLSERSLGLKPCYIIAGRRTPCPQKSDSKQSHPLSQQPIGLRRRGMAMEPPPIKPYGVPCLNLPPVFRNLRGTFFICRFRADCRLCLVGRWRSCTSPACPTCTQHSVHPNRALHSVRPRFQSPQLLAVDTIPIHMPRTHQLRRTADPLRPMARVTAPTRRTRIPHLAGEATLMD